MTANAASLLRIAGQHSLCADDAHDAYQRTLEIYLERLDEVDEATEGAWLRTVCKHEAMRIRDQRQRLLAPEDVVWELHLPAGGSEVEERASSLERVARAAEALQGCKPDEATAMLLKADGSSYAEIGELTGWSYTKVDRCLKEGRARFLRRFSAIDSGAACADWAPLLAAIVDGRAAAEDLARVRPHLRHCAGCRGTLKALYETQPALGALVPAGWMAADSAGGVLSRAYEALVTGLGDRLVRAQAVVEAVTSTKAAAVVASTAAVAAGGVTAGERLADRPAHAAVTADAQSRERTGREPHRAPPARPAVTSAPRAAGQPASRGAQEPRRGGGVRERAVPARSRSDRRSARSARRKAATPADRREPFAPAPEPAATPVPATDEVETVPAVGFEHGGVASRAAGMTRTRQDPDAPAEFGFEG